jgi:16S rRNA G527 N7-methylase RsmG
MVEVKARKSAFLREAIRHLELKDATVETSRYEELLAGPNSMRASTSCHCGPSVSSPKRR